MQKLRKIAVYSVLFGRSLTAATASGAATASTSVTASAPCAAATVIRSASSFMMQNRTAMHDLFDPVQEQTVALGTDAVGLRPFACDIEAELLAALWTVSALAPFRNIVTPGGDTKPDAITNCRPARPATAHRR